ncbi:hypothetical protein [Fusobacterium ulcerans]|uniref:Uncharacterized protein n=1 Tax=Fusobacterium ulcerans 12-1B TaxID=457404 RepID=H1PYR3_9FUSO|nr:hypothetical protein [Fusobacterium ulcerans]EHO77252.1 hypothetical protein HMPREF0402_03556 [Fusobacterium ulcerans 12-1B]
MTYDEFILDLNKYYYDFWNIGLKKKANLSLKKYLQDFNENISEENRFNIWYTFCENHCKKTNLRKDLPYEISQNVIYYLNKFSYTMPQMKWLYVLTRDVDILDEAFNHKDCDQEVIEYKFETYINMLDWGAHHASEGIVIITTEEVQEAITSCLSMISKYKIPLELQNSFHYNIKLYELLNLFSESDYENFSEFCKDNNFPFNEIGTFYYKK